MTSLLTDPQSSPFLLSLLSTFFKNEVTKTFPKLSNIESTLLQLEVKIDSSKEELKIMKENIEMDSVAL